MNTFKRQAGFTILELMIATSVLSVVLLIATAAMIGIGKVYYKGSTEASIQDANRAALDQITQDIQLSPGTFTNVIGNSTSPPYNVFLDKYNYGAAPETAQYTVHAFCMETSDYEFRYTFITGLQLNSSATGYNLATPPASQIKHVLWRDEIAYQAECTPADLNADDPSATPPAGTLAAGVDFTPGLAGTGKELVPPNSRLLSLNVSGPSGGPFNIGTQMAYGDYDLLNGLGANALCKGGAGDEYCATSSLSTIASARLTVNN